MCGSWEERNGLHRAKWGSERTVLIPSRVAKELDLLARDPSVTELEDSKFSFETRGALGSTSNRGLRTGLQ